MAFGRPRPRARVDSTAMTAPKRFPDRDEIAAVRSEAEPLDNGGAAETTRRIAGRAMARREMGKLVFLDVVDRSGRIQAICDTAVTGDVEVHLGDVVGIVGKPGKSRRGEPSRSLSWLKPSRIRSSNGAIGCGVTAFLRSMPWACGR